MKHNLLHELFITHNNAGLWAAESLRDNSYDMGELVWIKQRELLRDAFLLEKLLITSIIGHKKKEKENQ